ncbi:putative Methyltransferase domain-containing protein [Candidatus Hydrogenisulfobacillus filiaventi]|uniref:Putative Methyltransferase domain-containing protein n=1 Tax=Candidatus Hydrogenisulfobacillus filiaventi TaxID=2707344 RepID=A0A6F8ZD36_9FIRM|nr:class I SAM-dependent methyltransferase [Bacillota bacterium]CAB1127677.1 putative Methyltransferase domain-containing protein [Candidatus Hydrogenisulfobacillus filiaventi]
MAGFDAAVAARYDRFCTTPLGHYVDTVERALLARQLALVPGMTVVDVGAGTGAYSLWLAEQGARVWAVEPSAAMRAVAAAKALPPAVTLLEGRAEALPLPDGLADRVLLQVTLEFVDDPTRALAEAVRVLRPGGRLVLGLIAADGAWAAHYRARARREPAGVWARARFFTPEGVAALLPPPPPRAQGGLFTGPEEFTGEEPARTREARPPAGARPGFWALAWDKP